MKSINTITKGIALVAASMLVISCNTPKSNNEAPVLDLQSSVQNLPPNISCELTQTDSSGTITDRRIISSFASNDSPFSALPNVGTSVGIDCSGTSDESTNESISFAIDTQYDVLNPNFQPINGKSDSIGLYLQGNNLMALKATDSNGADSIKLFGMVAGCESYDPPVFDPASVSIEEIEYNKFKYTVVPNPPNSDPNSLNLLYSWDFNGDGTFEKPSDATHGIWTDKLVSTAYSIYVGDRTPILRVFNGCASPVEFAIENKFSFSDNQYVVTRDATSLADDSLPFEYVQADISDEDGESAALNAETLITWAGGDPRYVECSLSKQPVNGQLQFNVNALKTYSGKKPHGYTFSTLVDPPIGDSLTTEGWHDRSSPENASMKTFNFSTDGAGDSDYTGHTYSKTSSCELHITVVYGVGLVPCKPVDTPVPVLRQFYGGNAYGEFRCDNLSSSNDDSIVSAKYGKFSCAFNPVDKCKGGGGGGGGGIEPTAQ